MLPGLLGLHNMVMQTYTICISRILAVSRLHMNVVMLWDAYTDTHTEATNLDRHLFHSRNLWFRKAKRKAKYNCHNLSPSQDYASASMHHWYKHMAWLSIFRKQTFTVRTYHSYDGYVRGNLSGISNSRRAALHTFYCILHILINLYMWYHIVFYVW